MVLNFELCLLLWRNTAACEGPPISCVFLPPVEADLFMMTLKVMTCCLVIPGYLITAHNGRNGRNFTAGLNPAAVRPVLVTDSDKYRALWSSPLHLCLLLGAKERPHHLGATAILIHPH